MDDIKKFLDPSNELLKSFKNQAPASFKHCQNVGDLCEILANELGLDPDKAKLAGLYHDIGKMLWPSNFTENQNGEGNIHDTLEPFVSFHLITRHVPDGVMILVNEPDFPMEVIRIISKHHGDTVLASIYNKCKDKSQEAFRYKAPKPNDPYSCILMICDIVEARARYEHGSGALTDKRGIVRIVEESITKLMDDTQLDEMKIGRVRLAKEKLIKELESIHHKRTVTYEENERDSDNEMAGPSQLDS